RPWAATGGTSAAVACSDGDCGRCGMTMVEQVQYTPRPWRVVEKGRGRYMRGYDAAADEAERLKADLAAARAEAERWQAALVAAREVVEAARRVANAKYDVDPADVYELGEAIRRYDERCGGVSR